MIRGRFRYIIENYKLVEIFLTILFIVALSISIHSLLLGIRFGDRYPGFFVYSNGMVSIMQRNNWNGIKSGLIPLDIILAVNKLKVNNGSDINEIARNVEPGTELNYRILRGGRERDVFVKTALLTGRDKIFTFYLPYSIGLFFLIIGGVVFFIKTSGRPNRVFLIFCSLIGIFFTTGFEVNTTYIYSRVWLLYPFFGAASLHLFLIFPEERQRIKRYPWLLLIPYIIVGIPVLFHEIFYNSYKASFFFFKSIPVLMGMFFFINIGVLSYTAFMTSSPAIRHKARALIIAVLCASTFGVLWSITFPLRSEYVTLDRAVILSLIFPVFMTYAILKENIFDFDRFLQNTMIYALLSAILVGVYFITVGVVSFFSQKIFFVGRTPFENILSIVALLAIFHPLRVYVQRFIRRTFYMDEVRVQSELLELLTELGKVVNLEEIANSIVSWIKKNMKFESTFYRFEDNKLSKISSTSPETTDSIFLPPTLSFEWIKPREFIVVRELLSKKKTDPEIRYILTALNSSVIVPIKFKDKFHGILGIGRLGIDTFINQRDVELLKIIGENLGRYVDNAINFNEKARQERLATLGKMGAIIVHEIKNPLGIIKSSVATLKKRLDLGGSERELLNFIEEEADRINETIKRVLEYARPPEPIMNKVDLVEILKRSTRMMEEQLRSHNIIFEFELPDSPLFIKGDPNLLHQAILNILRNSMEVMANGGKLKVRISDSEGGISSETDGSVIERMKELSSRVFKTYTGQKKAYVIIEDTGPGIKKGEEWKIFEPFYSTKQDGTGLGLAITKQIIESHKGVVRAENCGERGLRFIIEIPLYEG